MNEEEELDSELFKEIWNKIDYRDLLIIVMLLLLFIMYSYHKKDILACNTFFNDLLINRSLTNYELLFS